MKEVPQLILVCFYTLGIVDLSHLIYALHWDKIYFSFKLVDISNIQMTHKLHAEIVREELQFILAPQDFLDTKPTSLSLSLSLSLFGFSKLVTHSLFIIVIFFQDVPFRTSHDIVGRSVALCVSKGCQLQDLHLKELRTISPFFDEDVYEFLGVENAVKKFSSYGSTGSECVASQLDYWVTKLEIK